MKLIENKNYQELIQAIDRIYSHAKNNIVSAINTEMLNAYWEIGKYIVEFEQNGNFKAEYGSELLLHISKDLTNRLGKGFSRSNLSYMRKFYYTYPNCETVSHKLSWSHYFELLKIEDDLAREFYQQQAITENWTVRELKRQKKSALFHRIAVNQDKEKILSLAKQGQIITNEQDLIKDPYVFEFLGIAENASYNENDIETAIINNLQTFLLELGKGFSFVGRQQRISLDFFRNGNKML